VRVDVGEQGVLDAKAEGNGGRAAEGLNQAANGLDLVVEGSDFGIDEFPLSTEPLEEWL